MKRKLLSVLLTFCLAFSLLPTAALADEENVAKVGETEYATLAEAVTAAKEAAKTNEIHSATITLLKNTELAAGVKLDGNDRVVNENPLDINIDLNNCTLDMKGFSFTIENGAVLEIFDGQIDSTLESITTAAFYVNAESSCLLDNVTMTTTGVAVFARGDCALAAVNKSNITAGTYAVTTNAASSDNYNPVFNIVGSTLKGLSPVLVNVPCELNITDSTINGSMHGVIVRGGTANITGSTITQTYTDDDYQTMADYFNNRNWESGNTVNLGALIVGNKHTTSYQYPSAVTVTDTVIKTAGAHADLFPAIYTYANNAADKGVNLSIGGDKTNVSGKVVKGNEEYNTISISGGAFTDLANAVKYAADGATIKLLKDVTGMAVIPSGKTVAIDLSGHTITRTVTSGEKGKIYPALYVNGGTLTLDDTSEGKTGRVLSEITDTTVSGAMSNAVYVNGGTFTLKNGALAATAAAEPDNNTWDTAYGVYVNKSTFTMENGSVTVTAPDGGAYGIAILGPNGVFTMNDGAVTADGFAISGNGSSGVGDTKITINKGTVTGGTLAIYHPQSGELKINGGTLTGKGGIETKAGNTTVSIDGNPTIVATGTPSHSTNNNGNSSEGYAISVVENKNYAGGANVSIASGYYKGEVRILMDNEVTDDKKGSIIISGGLFSSDPSAYVPATHHVEDSGNGSYPFAVKEGVKSDATIIVTAATNATVSSTIKTEDKDKIEAVKAKANVEGMAAAIRDDKKAAIAKAAGVTDGQLAGKNMIETEITVKVEAKAADLANSKLTFEASPEATVKVNGTATGTTVPVTNDMLNGQPITVKLPLPADFELKQIIHKSAGYADEYILQEGNAQGLKSFKIVEEDGVKIAVFTVSHFSDFELSGKVTYVAPSYSGGSSDPTYSVSTPSKTEHGTVTVSPKNASKGDRVTVTVKPDSGYVLETLTVTDKNGNELTLKDKGNGKYTFTMPAGKVEVKATFMEDNSMLNFFYDVPNNAYFYEAVKWAVKNGITTGVGNNLFAPEQPCTRAQIVTFLWRAAGSPEPKGAASGMTDVVSGSYYEKAVAWAIENGITTGTTTSTFSPDATCTRAQAVTFLARALKAKAASAAEFSDVPNDSYFADAVAWAAANGVTEGIGGGLFGSDNDCTRGQIVTFLYRAYNK